jgi:hypothetical protein
MRWAGLVARMRERERRSYSMWIGKPEGMRPLRKPIRKWEYNIKNDFQERVWRGIMDSVDLAQEKE